MVFALLRNRWFWVCLGICLLGGCVYLWMERTSLQAWHYARQLAGSSPEQRHQYLERLVYLDSEAVPALLVHFNSSSPQARSNCSWALTQLGRRWRTDQLRSLRLLRAVALSVPKMSPEGRDDALASLAAIAAMDHNDAAMPAAWDNAAGQLLVSASGDVQSGGGALELAHVLLRQSRSLDKEFVAACRRLAEAGLRDEALPSRIAAVRLAALPELNLLDRVAELAYGLKADPNPEVRSLALTAVAAHEDVAATEDLLPLLHDGDAEVRATCEHALRGRGLTGPHMQLARQMTDPQPSVRARVPAQVQDFVELDSSLWLDRLSKDPSPAVRAAVLRAAAEGDTAQMAGRFKVMAKEDPSPTVRQIAAYYLRTK